LLVRKIQIKPLNRTGIQDSVRVASTISFCFKTPWLPGPITGHLARGGIVGDVTANQLSIDSDSAFASDSHAVQTQLDTWLPITKMPFIVQAEFGHTLESNQVVGGSFENEGAVGLMNFEFGGDLATPGSQGAVTDLQVLDLHKLSLFPFQPFPERITQRLDFVYVPVLVPTSELGQSENQNNQSVLQHRLSFGSLTLPLD
jgi:hypothetical protein